MAYGPRSVYIYKGAKSLGFCFRTKKEKTKNPTIFMIGFSWSGWQDSNLRPPRPKRGAITGLRYTPSVYKIYLKKRRDWDSNPGDSYPSTD